MAKNVIGEVIGRWIAGALTIWWVTVYVTQDDIADKYKENT